MTLHLIANFCIAFWVLNAGMHSPTVHNVLSGVKLPQSDVNDKQSFFPVFCLLKFHDLEHMCGNKTKTN